VLAAALKPFLSFSIRAIVACKTVPIPASRVQLNPVKAERNGRINSSESIVNGWVVPTPQTAAILRAASSSSLCQPPWPKSPAAAIAMIFPSDSCAKPFFNFQWHTGLRAAAGYLRSGSAPIRT